MDAAAFERRRALGRIPVLHAHRERRGGEVLEQERAVARVRHHALGTAAFVLQRDEHVAERLAIGVQHDACDAVAWRQGRVPDHLGGGGGLQFLAHVQHRDPFARSAPRAGAFLELGEGVDRARSDAVDPVPPFAVGRRLQVPEHLVVVDLPTGQKAGPGRFVVQRHVGTSQRRTVGAVHRASHARRRREHDLEVRHRADGDRRTAAPDAKARRTHGDRQFAGREPVEREQPLRVAGCAARCPDLDGIPAAMVEETRRFADRDQGTGHRVALRIAHDPHQLATRRAKHQLDLHRFGAGVAFAEIDQFAGRMALRERAERTLFGHVLDHERAPLVAAGDLPTASPTGACRLQPDARPGDRLAVRIAHRADDAHAGRQHERHVLRPGDHVDRHPVVAIRTQLVFAGLEPDERRDAVAVGLLQVQVRLVEALAGRPAEHGHAPRGA